VLVLARLETSSLLRCLIVTVMVVVGVFVLALCAEGACPSCAHEYYGNVDRSKHLLARLTLGVQAALATVFAPMRLTLLSSVREVSCAVAAVLPDEPLHKAMALRI